MWTDVQKEGKVVFEVLGLSHFQILQIVNYLFEQFLDNIIGIKPFDLCVD